MLHGWNIADTEQNAFQSINWSLEKWTDVLFSNHKMTTQLIYKIHVLHDPAEYANAVIMIKVQN